MKKIIFISSLLLFTALPIWIVWDKEQKGVEMMTGGFGTQYADAPHPFNRPDYPVRCQGILGNDREDVVLTIHQGETVLRIPRDAIREVKKRSDSETCIPISIKLVYVWHDNKLLRAVTGNSEANEAGITSSHMLVTITLKGLQEIDDNSTQTEQKPNRYGGNERYIPAYRHNFLPIWYYPNLRYDHENTVGHIHGYGIANTRYSKTNHPYLVSCSLKMSTIGGSGENRYDYYPEDFVNAEMIPTSDWGDSKCVGGKIIKLLEKEVSATVEIKPQVVFDMDVIFNSIDSVIQDYATPSSTTNSN